MQGLISPVLFNPYVVGMHLNILNPAFFSAVPLSALLWCLNDELVANWGMAGAPHRCRPKCRGDAFKLGVTWSHQITLAKKIPTVSWGCVCRGGA